MATPLEANLALMAALASAGLGLLLGIIGLVTARRLGTPKLTFVALGFLILSGQGVWFALQIRNDPIGSADAIMVPSFLGLAALLVLYIAAYRRA